MRRVFLLLLAVVMILGLALPVWAEETEETKEIVLDSEPGRGSEFRVIFKKP